MSSIFSLASTSVISHKNKLENKLIPRRMIFPNEEKLPTPLNYIIVYWLWVCARSALPTILVSSHVCVLLAACYKMASKLRWTCVYYSLEKESKSDERTWIHYEITERNLLALIWVKKILQAPECPCFYRLIESNVYHTQIGCLCLRIFEVYKIEFDNNKTRIWSRTSIESLCMILLQIKSPSFNLWYRQRRLDSYGIKLLQNTVSCL